jgi:hypothetical protein
MAATFNKDALATPRIPASEYKPKFLDDLRARKQVTKVDEGWGGDATTLPPGVNWVIYPNGDLQRIDMN